MSKVDFSKKMSTIIENKIDALENLNYNEFLKKDDYFELALCLAYLTLSKEKIIDKELKNPRRLDRLKKHVPTIDIDALFSQGFSDKMPIISNSKEDNNLWILDNIRDSIMHEMLEIDEIKKCLVIKNDYYDRDLECEIPFSWIVDYAKYDILGKKISNKYTFKGFYYNKNKKNYSYLNTKKEILNTILYSVNITGNKFNIKKIEKRIAEIFKECSLNNIDEKIIKKYKNQININKKHYNEKYLISFYYAADTVKNKISQEFPDITLDIYINERKNNLINQASRKLANYYTSYDLLCSGLNELIKPKGIILLNYLTSIIENLGSGVKDINTTTKEKMCLINSILTNEKKQYSSLNDIYNEFYRTLNILRMICINTYGICTLVINNSHLYKKYYEKSNNDILESCTIAYTNQDYLENAKKRKKIILDILEQEIKLFEKQTQLNKCTNIKGAVSLKICINSILNNKNLLEQQLCDLEKNINFVPYINYNNYNSERINEISSTINNYFNHFFKCQTVKGKKKVKKVISKILDIKIEEETKYIYRYCNNSNEVIEIIRNCLSHIGRINIIQDDYNEAKVIFNDYDNNHIHSGTVVMPYKQFIKVLNYPLSKTDENKNLKTLTIK
ncbi:MAG: hypothetical protein E7166_00085 [Firmicutes bacterium]|nr:hypothetical protein [Bacillota bacterium]